MNPRDFEFGLGRVDFWELDRLRRSVPLREQREELNEDLARVVFGDDVTLDVGWYPAWNLSGRFVVVVVRGGDWCQPLFTRECSDVDSLAAAISEAAAFAGSLLPP